MNLCHLSHWIGATPYCCATVRFEWQPRRILERDAEAPRFCGVGVAHRRVNAITEWSMPWLMEEQAK